MPSTPMTDPPFDSQPPRTDGAARSGGSGRTAAETVLLASPPRRRLLLAAAVWLSGCASRSREVPPTGGASASGERQEVVIFSLSLIDTGYRFGGKNPEAGVDCSGMVSYVYQHAAGRVLTGSAADIARHGRPVPRDEAAPADLVFFNTRGGPYTHVGIYIGDGRFIHAPSSNGKVRLEAIDRGYFGQRFTGARTYFE
jgi:cell wall-associated NlpC family hydrolase